MTTNKNAIPLVIPVLSMRLQIQSKNMQHTNEYFGLKNRFCNQIHRNDEAKQNSPLPPLPLFYSAHCSLHIEVLALFVRIIEAVVSLTLARRKRTLLSKPNVPIETSLETFCFLMEFLEKEVHGKWVANWKSVYNTFIRSLAILLGQIMSYEGTRHVTFMTRSVIWFLEPHSEIPVQSPYIQHASIKFGVMEMNKCNRMTNLYCFRTDCLSIDSKKFIRRRRSAACRGIGLK